MKASPRVFIDMPLEVGKQFELSSEQHHYLAHVMRADRFLAFNGGKEYEAEIIGRSRFVIRSSTERRDPSGEWTFCFAPIKRAEDLIAGVVQFGAGILQPVITERTVARRVNWARMRKIIVENCEQSGRGSVPELREPIPFAALDKRTIVYGDERKAAEPESAESVRRPAPPARRGAPELSLMVGPEGGFSDAEFAALDAAGAIGARLGGTILRAEVAAVALCAKCLL
ncbi:MAG: 16S rRNA (uracil(1498)-N(3))-methyltransferase [Rickettsiales bacterium]|jgi:16S rRNA (uracil1498-N3)-methyltransferase|nr:16S rRNA (uracil(1498)-N(3))-methyltransferase [Rickettsiales bacterium]